MNQLRPLVSSSLLAEKLMLSSIWTGIVEVWVKSADQYVRDNFCQDKKTINCLIFKHSYHKFWPLRFFNTHLPKFESSRIQML